MNLTLALVVVLLTLKPFAADPVVTADTLSIWLGGLAAVCCVVTAVRTRGALRRSWLLFGTTMTMWAVADLLWYAYGTASDGFHSVLSVADALYLLGLVPASAVALVLFPAGTWERGAGSRLVLWTSVALGAALLLLLHACSSCDEVFGAEHQRFLGHCGHHPRSTRSPTCCSLPSLLLLLIRTAGPAATRPRARRLSPSPPWTVTDNGYALFLSRGTDYRRELLWAVGYVGRSAAARARGTHLAGFLDAAPAHPETRINGDPLLRCCPTSAVLGRAIGPRAWVDGLGSWQDWLLAAVGAGCSPGSGSWCSRLGQLTPCAPTSRADGGSRGPDAYSHCTRLSERHRSILEAGRRGHRRARRGRGRSSSSTPKPLTNAGWARRPSSRGCVACATLCPRTTTTTA